MSPDLSSAQLRALLGLATPVSEGTWVSLVQEGLIIEAPWRAYGLPDVLTPAGIAMVRAQTDAERRRLSRAYPGIVMLVADEVLLDHLRSSTVTVDVTDAGYALVISGGDTQQPLAAPDPFYHWQIRMCGTAGTFLEPEFPTGKAELPARYRLNAFGRTLLQSAQRDVDEAAVDRFGLAMRQKMTRSRDKGRNGWQDPKLCPVERLADMFVGHLAKTNAGNLVDLACLAMMLHERGAAPDAVPAAVARQRAEAGGNEPLIAALAPFARFGLGEDAGDPDIAVDLLRERICDWFGLSDFRGARLAWSGLTGIPMPDPDPELEARNRRPEGCTCG